jgi:hypothetical protein
LINTPVNYRNTLVDFKNIPVDYRNTPVDFKNIPVDYTNTPVNYKIPLWMHFPILLSNTKTPSVYAQISSLNYKSLHNKAFIK